MILAKVLGNVVATQKNHRYENARVMLCESITPEGEATGYTVLALDAVDAGVQTAAAEPGEIGLAHVGVQDGLRRLEPGDPLRLLAPEHGRIVQRLAVQPLVFHHRTQVRVLRDAGLDRDHPGATVRFGGRTPDAIIG